MKRPFPAASGALAAACPAPIALVTWAHGAEALSGLTWMGAVAVLASLCFTAAALAIYRRPPMGRALAAAGLLGTLVAVAEALVPAPRLALLVLLGITAIGAGLWSPSSGLLGRALARHPLHVARARSASLVAMGLWLVASLGDHIPDTSAHTAGELVSPGASLMASLVAVFVSLLIAILLSASWLVQDWAAHRLRAAVLAGSAVLALVGVVLSWGNWSQCLFAVMLVPATTVIVLPVEPRQGLERVDWWAPVADHPARFLAVTFFALCLVGTVLLALPISAARGVSIGLVDAAFTAVSAVCVTGLAVLDTSRDFSTAGQVAILVLIQLGGLGIMTFSTMALRLLGRRMSLRHEGMVAGLMSQRDRSRLFSSTRRLIVFTVAVEACGAGFLAWMFWQTGDGPGHALWRGLFTAVSAFCNAGFALQTDNLVPYHAHPGVLHVVGLLIITGSLSPAASVAIPSLLTARRAQVPVQIKIGLVTTIVLLVAGFVLIAAIEWNNTLGGMSLGTRLHNAWFQSVTLRTAGFNSIDLAEVRPATLTMMLVWMFIGGNPASTAGGVKTTTIAVLVLAVLAAIRGRPNALAFGRRISHISIYRATAIVAVGAAAGLGALMAVQLTQRMPTRLAVFEVVSALGTVGLTIGGTGLLDGVGKAIIIGCMFMGRVGPLTLFMFLSNRTQHEVWKRPEEDIDVG